MMCVCGKGLTLLIGGEPAPTERFPVHFESRVRPVEKAEHQGWIPPESIPEQESGQGFRHPNKPEQKPECAT